MELERTTPFTRNARLLMIAVAIVVSMMFIAAQTGKFKEIPEGQLPEPGLTPRNPFYAIDTLTERTLLYFAAFNKRKIELATRFSQEKLSEFQYLEAHPYGFYVGYVITENAKQEALSLQEQYRAIAGLPPSGIQSQGLPEIQPEPAPSSSQVSGPEKQIATSSPSGNLGGQATSSTSSSKTATTSSSLLKKLYSPSVAQAKSKGLNGTSVESKGTILLATVAETTTRFLSQPLPPFKDLWTRFYDRLPEFLQRWLSKAGEWIKEKAIKIQTWGEQKFGEMVDFLKNEARNRLRDWIDKMLGFNKPR